jgi:hypothetical protein
LPVLRNLELRKTEEELNRNRKDRIKIEEKGGMKIKDMLESKNPFEKSKCVKKKLVLCVQKVDMLKPVQKKSKYHAIPITLGIDGGALHARRETSSKCTKVKPAGQLGQGDLNTSRNLKRKRRKVSSTNIK